MLAAYVILVGSTCASVYLWHVVYSRGSDAKDFARMAEENRQSIAKWRAEIARDRVQPQAEKTQSEQARDRIVDDREAFISGLEVGQREAESEAKDAREIAWSATWLAIVSALVLGLRVGRLNRRIDAPPS